MIFMADETQAPGAPVAPGAPGAPGTGEFVFRLRLPRGTEVLGVVTGRMGGSRFRVYCADKKDRMCRVPGKIKHDVWVKEGDIVIIEPWVIEGEKKGDIVWRYTKTQSYNLRKQGKLRDLPV